MIFLHTQKSITIFSFSGFDLKQRGRTNRVYTLGNEYIKLKKTNILQHGHIYGMINNNTLNSKACERNHTHTHTSFNKVWQVCICPGEQSDFFFLLIIKGVRSGYI